MNTARNWSLALAALLSGLPAFSQSADVTAPMSTSPVASTIQPSLSSSSSGSAKTVLVAYGPYITGVGTGCGGADVSELGSGLVTFGWSAKSGADSLADDFTVPGSTTWTITGVKWLAYQVGAATTGTITGLNLNLWNTDPTGTFPGGEWITGPANSLTSTNWTGVYRVDSSAPDCMRAIMQVTADGSWMPAVSTGTYWLETQCSGTLANGPWTPPEVPAPLTANALQSAGGGAFAVIVDGAGVTDSTPQDLLFQLEGQSSGGGLGQFCTSKPSSIPTCMPTLFGTGTTVSKTSGSYTMTATPVPGGAGKPGILIWTKNGLLGTPVNTPFGFLCLSQFQRAGNFPASPGGTNGVCNGTYNWPFQSIVASFVSIIAGDNLHVQGWYRDAGFPPPGNANFTNGVGPVAVTP
jgi:hypothetical protein